jgi:hypothetical protein
MVLCKYRVTPYYACYAYAYENYNNPVHPNSPHLTISYQLPNDDNGEYVYTVEPNKEDSYHFYKDPLIRDNIFGVTNTILQKRDQKDGVYGALPLVHLTTISGTTYSGVQVIPDKFNYIYSTNLLEQNPHTNTNWTLADLDDNYFGFTTVSG